MQFPALRSHWPLTILMGASSLLNLFLPLILVRILPVEQVGLYKIFFLYAATAPWLLLSSGFGNGIYFWIGQNTTRKQSLSATWSYQLIWSTCVLLITGLLAPFIANLKFFAIDNSTFFMLGLSIAATISASFFEEYKIASGDIHKAAKYSAFWEALKTIGLASAALYFRSFDSIIAAYTLIICCKFVISNFLVLKNKFAAFSLKNNTQAKAVLKYALPSSGAAALAVVLGYCDQFILGYYLSASAFAIYSLGCLSIPPLLIFEQSVNKVMLPALTESFARNSRDAWKVVRTAMIDLGMWLIPAALGLFFFAGPITRMLFTDKYPETESFLRIYCFYYLAFVVPYDAWARAQGSSQWIFRTTAMFAVLSLLGTLLGVHLAGAYGALILFLASQFSIRIYSLFQMRKKLQWSLRQLIPFVVLSRSVFFSFLLGAITSYGISFFSNEKLGLVIMGLTFWLCYVLICVPWALRHERLEAQSKNVLLLTQYLNIGGLERMILNLSHELKIHGQWNPSVFVYDEITGSETLDAVFKEIQITRVSKGRGFAWKLPFQIARHCRQQYIHQIHAHDLGALIYAVLAKWASFGKLRIIYTQHSFVHLKKGFKYSVYENFFSKRADVLTVVSASLKEGYVQKGFKPTKVLLIENGIPFPRPLQNTEQKKQLKNELLRSYVQAADQKFWVLYLARLHPGKGQTEALDIWEKLLPKLREKCLLVIVGAETFPDYKNLLIDKIAQASNKQSIVLAGSTLQPEKWLQASDLLLSASTEEGLPLSPLEALSISIPVFLSDIPGHRIFSKYAEYFSLNDSAAAANKLSELIQKGLNQDIHVEKPGDILQRFTVERMAQEYARIYAEKSFTKAVL